MLGAHSLPLQQKQNVHISEFSCYKIHIFKPRTVAQKDISLAKVTTMC